MSLSRAQNIFMPANINSVVILFKYRPRLGVHVPAQEGNDDDDDHNCEDNDGNVYYNDDDNEHDDDVDYEDNDDWQRLKFPTIFPA